MRCYLFYVPLICCKRLVMLSITHNFGRIEPKLDIVETGEPTPHDPITRWRVPAASKVAAKPGQFGDTRIMQG